MKKNKATFFKFNAFIFAFFILTIPYICSPKEPAVQSMQVSFFSGLSKQALATSEPNQDVDYCFDMLKQFSALQKKRRLTLEEMMMTLQVMLFLFNLTTDDHSRRIEIVLNGKDKITVPYSAQIFAMLNQQQAEHNNQEPEDDLV